MATTITPNIVTLNVSITRAPTPSQLQQSGALVSVGGTLLATGSYQYCSTLSALTQILVSTGSGNYAELLKMGTTFFAQGNAVGFYVLELGYNANLDTQIYNLQTWITNNPSIFYAYLVPANWDMTADEVGSITVGVATYTYSTAPTVTLTTATGLGITATATAAINSSGQVTGITITNPGSYPSQSAPTATLSAATTGTAPVLTVHMSCSLNVLAGNYSSPAGMTYFFATVAQANLANYTGSVYKSLFLTVQAPTAPSTEFTAASAFYQWLVNSPGTANQLAPMAYRYAYGVTNWVLNGNQAAINTVLTDYANLILTGAQGGISTACLFKGTTMDGEQSDWWYGVDWFQIQVDQALSAAIINGSNSNPPLLYNQLGINTLQAVAQQVANNAVTFGCLLSATVTATPFITYTNANPTHYNAGIYNGLYAAVVGQNGFLTITFNLNVSEFA